MTLKTPLHSHHKYTGNILTYIICNNYISLITCCVQLNILVIETRLKNQDTNLQSPPVVPYDLVYVDNSQGEELSQGQIPLVHYDDIDTQVTPSTNGTLEIQDSQDPIQDHDQLNGLQPG